MSLVGLKNIAPFISGNNGYTSLYKDIDLQDLDINVYAVFKEDDTSIPSSSIVEGLQYSIVRALSSGGISAVSSIQIQGLNSSIIDIGGNVADGIKIPIPQGFTDYSKLAYFEVVIIRKELLTRDVAFTYNIDIPNIEELSTLSETVTKLEKDVGTNKTNIDTNTTNIGTNTTGISKLEGVIKKQVGMDEKSAGVLTFPSSLTTSFNNELGKTVETYKQAINALITVIKEQNTSIQDLKTIVKLGENSNAKLRAEISTLKANMNVHKTEINKMIGIWKAEKWDDYETLNPIT